MDEENFPRGGVRPSKRKLDDDTDTPDFLKDIHVDESEKSVTTNKDRSAKQKLRDDRKAWKKGKQQKEAGNVTKKTKRYDVPQILPVYAKDIVRGMLVLGCVQEIKDFELMISLPHGVSGIVKITDISDAYTKLLERITSGEEITETQNIGSLQEMFHVGQVVKCKVLDVNKKSKNAAVLTLNPREVNKAVVSTKVSDGMVFSGVVTSVEDHGYIIDLGINNLTAFLKKKSAKSYIQDFKDGAPLKIGQYVDCLLGVKDKMSLLLEEKRTIDVVIEPRKVYRACLTAQMDVVMNTLMPGSIVQAKVEQVTDWGLKVAFLGKWRSTIYKTHLERSCQSYSTGDEFKAVILHVNPVSKDVTLTQLPHLVAPDLAPRRRFGDFAVADIVDDAKVTYADSRTGVYVKLSDRVTGLAHLTQLSDKPIKHIVQKFPKDSSVKCRVMGFLYTDNVALVSFRQSVLDRQFLSYETLQPGDVVKCEVEQVQKRGVTVRLGHNIRGFVPLVFLAENHVSKKKKVSQLLSPGDAMSCRVLTCNPKQQRLVLTNKKSLVKAAQPAVTSYDHVSVDDVLEGVIVSVRQNGVVVVFYNDVKGWVPKNHLSSEPIEYPSKVFYEGQVVKCRVKEVNPDDNKMILSFVVRDHRPYGTINEKKIPADFQYGKVVTCIVTGKSADGLDVRIDETDVVAFLPTSHLSDDLSLCGALYDVYRVGDSIDKCVYYSKRVTLLVSHKRSLMAAADDGSFTTSFSQILPDTLVTGVVKQIMTYGIFVELHGELRGLVPLKYITTQPVTEPLTLFKVGQTVTCKVVEVDAVKERFLLSLTSPDCHADGTDVSIDVLDSYLSDYAFLQHRHGQRKGVSKALASLSLGDVVTVDVTDVNEHGALCKLPGGVKGFATQDLMKDAVVVAGKQREMIVLYVDFARELVELCCTKHVLDAVKAFTDNKYSAVKVGQTMKSEVVLIKEEFAVVMLIGNTKGRLAYVPTRQYRNDVLGSRAFVIGQLNGVTLKRMSGSSISAVRACLSMYERAAAAADRHNVTSGDLTSPLANKPPVVGHNLAVGDVVSGTVLQVRDYYVDIVIDDSDVTAHAHISQLVDDVVEGSNPTKDMKEGKKVKARVIGLKEAKSAHPKYLPITSPKRNHSEVEVTLKKSVVNKAELSPTDEAAHNTCSVDDVMTAFYVKYQKPHVWFQIKPNLMGRCLAINASDDAEVCNNPAKHFKPNHAYRAVVCAPQRRNVCDVTLAPMTSPQLTHDAVAKARVLGSCRTSGLHVMFPRGNYRGFVQRTDVSDAYSAQLPRPETIVWCYVLDASSKKKLVLSTRKSRTGKGVDAATHHVTDREILLYSQLHVGDVIRGFVIKQTPNFVLVKIGTEILGKATEHDENKYNPGQCVTVKVTAVDESEGKVAVRIVGDDVKVSVDDSPSVRPAGDTTVLEFRQRMAHARELVEAERQRQEEERQAKKAERQRLEAERQSKEAERQNKKAALKRKREEGATDSGVESGDDKATSKQRLSLADTVAAAQTGSDSSESDDEDTGKQPQALSLDSVAIASRGVGNFAWTDDFTLPAAVTSDASDSDDDDVNDDVNDDAAKHPKAKKRKSALEEEKEIYKRERQLLTGDTGPLTSVTDLERLVRLSPDSSICWLRYIAHHLERHQAAAARAVAERALQTINYREEQEKLNVWVAYLNLEHLYGTPDTLRDVFQRAVQYCEPVKLYTRLIDIYTGDGKLEEANELHAKCVKKYGARPEVWLSYARFLYCQRKRLHDARALLQRSFDVLEPRHHADVIATFAHLEYTDGEPWHGQSLFESVIRAYSKRIDLWTQYAQCEAKAGNIEHARTVWARLTSSDIPPKHRASVLQKYIAFEEAHGSAAEVKRLKEQTVKQAVDATLTYERFAHGGSTEQHDVTKGQLVKTGEKAGRESPKKPQRKRAKARA